MLINRKSTRDQVTEILLERILEGIYKPGERLIELQIAGELQTSQGPVREALRDLEGMGLVESERYRGTRVREITDLEIEEAFQIRGILEELAASLAAPKLIGKTDALRKEVEAFTQAAKDKDLKAYAEHDMEFHRMFVEASGNQMLLSVWESVVLEARFRLTLKSRIGVDELETFAHAHQPILAALEAGESTQAGKLAKDLIYKFHARKMPKR